MRVRQASRSLKDGLRNTEVDVGHAIAHGANDGENEGSHEGRNRGAQGRAVDSWWLTLRRADAQWRAIRGLREYRAKIGEHREDLADLLMALGDDAWAAVVGVLFRPYY